MNETEKFLKDNILFLIIPVLILFVGLYYTYQGLVALIDSNATLTDKIVTRNDKQSKLAQYKANAARLKREHEEASSIVKKSGSGKVIYEVLGQQFSPEASFGIMFENILSNITKSGIRIRSIDYNYKPQNDKILAANDPAYNACELSFVTVGTYSQLQDFFKNITKEDYLTGIYEVYIEPYDKDKTILIAKFKIRLYTKIING